MHESNNIYSVIQKVGNDFGNKIAIYNETNSITYANLITKVNEIASTLKDIGVESGKFITIIMENCIEYILTILAINKLNAIIVPINPQYKKNEIQYILDETQSEIIITTTYNKHIINSFKHQYKVVTISDKSINIESTEIESKQSKAKVMSEKDLALCIFTSGTTGKPKGVLLSNKSILFNIDGVVDRAKYTYNDIVLSSLPVFHCYSITVNILSVLRVGATIDIMDGFIPDKIVNKLELKNITVFSGAPVMYNLLLKYLKKEDYNKLSNVRLWLSGGAPLPEKISNEFELISQKKIVEGYSLTEASPVVCCNPINAVKINSIGLPLKNIIIKIVDKNNKIVKSGESGELCIKGKNIMQGYLNNKIETNKVLIDGWFYTGDIAIQDQDGYIFIKGRKKEMILVGGYNVYPKEIEDCIKNFSNLNVAVVGVSDENLGEKVIAFIEKEKEISFSKIDLLRECRKNLANYKIPKEIIYLERLPINSTGKIDKIKLKKKYYDIIRKVTS